MSSMQLRRRNDNGKVGLRSALGPIDENAPRTRPAKSALMTSKPVGAAVKANVTKPGAHQEMRAALGDLSNKLSTTLPHPAKVAKSRQTAVRSGPSSQKKRIATKTVAMVKVEAVKTLIKSEEKAKMELPKPVFPAESDAKKRKHEEEAPAPTLEDLVSSQVAKEPVEEQYWEDLDAADAGDHLMVSEYVVDIFKYMSQLEKETMPVDDYIKDQKELTWRMRSILVDWLIEVHFKFRLLPETLYLAVNLMDRFLSMRNVAMVRLQLVGLTAMLIASKYEEVVHPSIKNYLYMADNGYTEEDLLKAERYMLQVLGFSLQYPNPMNFLRRISKAEDYDIQTRTLGKYLMEITLLDSRFLKYAPSIVAAAAVYLARKMLDRTPVWNNNLRYYSGGYHEDELLPVVELMLDILSQPMKYEAAYKKYSSKKFMKSSIFVKDWVDKRYLAKASPSEAPEEESEEASSESVY